MKQDLSKPEWGWSYPIVLGCSKEWVADYDFEFPNRIVINPEAVGFVYQITRLSDGKRYIGKKLFWFKKTKRIAGKKRRVRSSVASDWLTYWSSCRELQEDIQRLGTQAFRRDILVICGSKAELSFQELQYQIASGFWDPKISLYNGIINVRLRRPRK